MSRMARIGVCAAALAAAGSSVASVPVASGGEKDGREHRQVRLLHRGGGGYLGVQLDDVSPEDVARLELQGERGAVVKDLVDDAPAAAAGVKEGDVIVRYEGEAVRSAAQLARLVRETPSGRTVQIELNRDGALQKLPVRLGERKAHALLKGMPELAFDLDLPEPPEPPEAPEAPEAPRLGRELLDRDWMRDFRSAWGGPRKLGISYQEISGQLARYFKLLEDGGVLVTEVDGDGPAGKAGLRAGDVILSFDGKDVRDGDDLRRAVRDAEAGRQVALKVQREGRPLDISVTLAAERERERRKGVGI